MSIQRIRRELYGALQAYQVIREVWDFVKPWLQAGHRLHLEVRADTRSLAQNRIMWSCLEDLSQQVDWYGRKLSDWDWKDVLTASLRGQDAVPNLDNTGFVILGQRTSQMTIAEMIDVITLAHAFGDGKGVKWRRTSLGRDVPDEVITQDLRAREPA